MNIKGKKIILGISGSIAAYKTPELVRRLVKNGAEVKIICTPAATQFVSSLALSTVSKNEVLTDINNGSNWNNHVALGRWADLMLIAPCSANSLAKLANGQCDNLLCAVYLSAICPIMIAPAMDEDMWHHPTCKNNLDKLKSYGNKIIPVAHGELASGLIGEGRMAEPSDIVQLLEDFFSSQEIKALKDKKALVTAGPTYEKIDPVRFIGNYSSGKMGIAIAEELARQGAQVTLVLGPSPLRSNHPNITTVLVESALEMYEAAVSVFSQCDIAILSAAVADYRPKDMATKKIKKVNTALALQLELNKDILAHLGGIKTSQQILVGFALETENELENAREKLKAKNADYIVLNSLNETGAGFGGDTNRVSIIGRNNTILELPLLPKSEVAVKIIAHITKD